MKKILIMFFGFILVLTSLVSAHTGEDELAPHVTEGMMSGIYGYGFMWVFGWFFMVFVGVALVLFIAWLIKQIQKGDKKKRKR